MNNSVSNNDYCTLAHFPQYTDTMVMSVVLVYTGKVAGLQSRVTQLLSSTFLRFFLNRSKASETFN